MNLLIVLFPILSQFESFTLELQKGLSVESNTVLSYLENAFSSDLPPSVYADPEIS